MLTEILQRKLIPWGQQSSSERFIVARPEMSAAQMPDSVQLKRRKVEGKRIIVKNRRYYENTRGIAALWPEAGLNEVNKYKLACVFGGHVDYQLGNYAVRCGPGHFIFIPPGMPHPDGSRSYVDTHKSTSCEILFFLLHPNALQCWVSHSQPDQRRKQEGNYLILHERATVLFRALMEEVLGEDKKSLLIGEQLLSVFLSVLQREVEIDRLQPIHSDNPNYAHEEMMKDSDQADFATRLGRYLQANLHKQLTTGSVAKEMFLSRAQFTRTVRRETGQSFNQLLTNYRIEEAKALLRNSQWTAASICAFVGFKSPSYFRTFFREHTGSTPSEFRVQAELEEK